MTGQTQPPVAADGHPRVPWDVIAPTVVMAVAYALSAVQIGRGLFPGAIVTWWLPPVVVIAVWTGALIPWLQSGMGIVLGRFVTGGFFFFAPSIVEAVASLTRAGWSVEQFLLQGVLPGVYVMCGYVLATQAGELLTAFDPPVGEGDTAPSAMARRSLHGRRQLVSLILKAWLVLAVANTLVAEVLPAAAYVAIVRPLALFVAIGLAGALVLLALVHRRLLHWQWQAQGSLAHTPQRTAWPLPWRLVVVAIPALASLFPFDVSPIARVGTGRFFAGMSERLAPLFISSSRGERSTASHGWLHQLLAGWGFFDPDDGAAAPAIDGTINAVSLVFLLGVTVVAMVMLYRWRRRPGRIDESSGPVRGRESIWRELWRWLLDMWQGLFGALGTLSGGAGGNAAKAKRRGLRRGRDKHRVGWSTDPARRLRQLFASLLAKLRRAGYPRQHNETAWEYAQRLAQDRPDAGAYINEMTAAYVEARYGHDQTVTSLEKAYTSIQEVGQRLLQVIRRRSAGQR